MHVDLLSAMSAIAESLRDLQDTDSIALDRLTATIVEVGGADLASITEGTAQGEPFTTVAPTAPLMVELDELQYRLRQGPCVDAVYEDSVQVSEDVSHDARWPQWGPLAAERGVQSAIGVHLYAASEAFGALNLYYLHPQHFTADDLDIARVFGAHASTTLAQVRRSANLTRAIESHALVGRAQGILMHKYGIRPDQAFSVLRRVSQNENVKLSSVAAEVIATGTLPTSADSGPADRLDPHPHS
jgi:GAF domain-containing protein